jgi:chromate reductase
MKVLAVSGSLRPASYNTALLRAARELAGPGVEVELYDGLKEIPPYDETDDTDWASRPLATNPLRNRPAAVVGASNGAFGAVWAQAELRKVLSAIGARVVQGEVALGHAPTRFDEEGRLADEQLAGQLLELVAALADAVREREALRAAA